MIYNAYKNEIATQTYLDLVKKHFPDADEREVDFILWEKTEFPIIKNPKVIEEQIMKFAKTRKD